MAGIRGVVYDLMKSYLCGRKMQVKANNIMSRPYPVDVGVPQGSILGPLLYLIYVNDLGKLRLNGNTRLFADDTSMFYTEPTTQLNMAALESDLVLIDEYFRINKLTVNLSKTEFIHFHANRAAPQSNAIIYKGTEIKNVATVKHLGVSLDDRLLWKCHINKLASKLSSVVGILTKISSFIPTHVMKLLYYALFHSRVEYASANWACACKSHLKPIQVLQNRALKVCHKLNNRHSTIDIYSNVAKNVIPISFLNDYQACKITHKIINNIQQSAIKFTYKNREGRRGHEITTTIKPKNRYGFNSIRFNGPAQFNRLPKQIRQCTNPKAFQRKIKNYYCNSENLKLKLY